jgi:cytochrome c-type biogenesis protein CcmH
MARPLEWLLAGALLITFPATGREAAPASDDPMLEARVMRISGELRCLVCQNETIAASHADLAVDLRRQVREMLGQGKAEREIYAYMTERYGDFVLYRPPLRHSTALLWFGPALLTAGGLIGLWWVLRRRSRWHDDQFEPEENIE